MWHYNYVRQQYESSLAPMWPVNALLYHSPPSKVRTMHNWQHHIKTIGIIFNEYLYFQGRSRIAEREGVNC